MSKSTTSRAQKPSPDAPIPFKLTETTHEKMTIGEIIARRSPGLEADPAGYTWDELVLACQEVAGEITFDLTVADHEAARRPLVLALVALAHDALDAFDRRFATAKAGAR